MPLKERGGEKECGFTVRSPSLNCGLSIVGYTYMCESRQARLDDVLSIYLFIYLCYLQVLSTSVLPDDLEQRGHGLESTRRQVDDRSGSGKRTRSPLPYTWHHSSHVSPMLYTYYHFEHAPEVNQSCFVCLPLLSSSSFTRNCVLINLLILEKCECYGVLGGGGWDTGTRGCSIELHNAVVVVGLSTLLGQDRGPPSPVGNPLVCPPPPVGLLSPKNKKIKDIISGNILRLFFGFLFGKDCRTRLAPASRMWEEAHDEEEFSRGRNRNMQARGRGREGLSDIEQKQIRSRIQTMVHCFGGWLRYVGMYRHVYIYMYMYCTTVNMDQGTLTVCLTRGRRLKKRSKERREKTPLIFIVRIRTLYFDLRHGHVCTDTYPCRSPGTESIYILFIYLWDHLCCRGRRLGAHSLEFLEMALLSARPAGHNNAVPYFFLFL